VAEIPHILLRAKHGVGAATRGGKFQISRFPGFINMVIGKTALSHHLKFPPSKVVEECVRISYPAKSQKSGRMASPLAAGPPQAEEREVTFAKLRGWRRRWGSSCDAGSWPRSRGPALERFE